MDTGKKAAARSARVTSLPLYSGNSPYGWCIYVHGEVDAVGGGGLGEAISGLVSEAERGLFHHLLLPSGVSRHGSFLTRFPRVSGTCCYLSRTFATASCPAVPHLMVGIPRSSSCRECLRRRVKVSPSTPLFSPRGSRLPAVEKISSSVLTK